jgi:hypothetical protein
MASVSQAIRQRVQKRAAERCEYCRLPDGISIYPSHVDHILALKHQGSSEMSNLAWACFHCNVAKGSDIAGYDPVTEELTPLYNPRIQVWPDHFVLDGPYIVGLTSVGRVTVALLQMNQPERIKTRQRLINIGRW